MKKFNAPEIKVEKFDLMDVITASATVCAEDICWEDCPDDTFSCPNQLGG